MLAINHVTLATGLTLAGSIYFQIPFFLPFLAFVVFASLLPDIDHPGSEISNYFPIINKAFPHRAVTHSILGVSIFMGLIYLLTSYSYWMSAALLVFSFIGIQYLGKLLSKRLHQLQHSSHKIISESQIKGTIRLLTRILDIFLVLLALLIWKEQYRDEIIVLLGVGYIGHIIGDFVTKDGIPLFWPIKIRSALKLFRTGGKIEAFLGILILGANIYLLWQFWVIWGLGSSEYWTGYLPILNTILN
jgi:inner membrane protein